ncbi:MAG: Zn-ribbon domain-containing OB-fold protein [Candidatus Micrarchaeia archaeon]
MRDALPLIWRNSSERYQLKGTVCENCGTAYFPPRKICAKCRRKGRLVAKIMPHDGKIVSYSKIHAAPAGFEVEAPYFVAIIELSNGARFLTQIVDTPDEKVREGAAVRLVFRRICEDEKEGAIAYGYKFKVV